MKTVCVKPEEFHELTDDIVELFFTLQDQLCGGYSKNAKYVPKMSRNNGIR